MQSELPQIFPSTSYTISESSSSFDLPGGKCPLEHAVGTADIMGSRGNALEEFLRWAATEGIQSPIHSQIGTLQTVSLYRETKSLLHHEFVIAGFGSTRVHMSWVRMERAAMTRLGKRGSMRPLLRGAQLRESVSFHHSREVLRGKRPNAELASVRIRGSAPQVLLHEFARQVSNTSDAFPLYTLLEANCRYFARRVTLGLAQLFPPAVMEFYWSGTPCTYEHLHDELCGDRHGGKTLSKDESLSVEFANTLARATTQLSIGEGFVVGLLCRGVIQGVKELRAPNEHHVYLVAAAHSILADADLSRGALSEALEHLATRNTLTSKVHFGSQQSRSLYLDMLEREADILISMGNINQAIPLLRHASHARRELYKEWGDVASAISLATCLALRAKCLVQLPNCAPEAISLVKEASDIADTAYARRPNLVRSRHVIVLTAQAYVNSEAGHHTEAWIISQKATGTAQEALQWRSYATRVDFATCLQQQAKYAAQLRLWQEACTLGEDSVRHWRLLYAQMPFNYWEGLTTTQRALATHFLSRGDILGSLALMNDNVDILREVYTKDASRRNDLIRALEWSADLLDELRKEPVDMEVPLPDGRALRLEAQSPRSLIKKSKSVGPSIIADLPVPPPGSDSSPSSEIGPRRPASLSSDSSADSFGPPIPGSSWYASDDDDDEGEWEDEDEVVVA